MITCKINFNPIIKIDDEQFYQLCRHNPEINFERNQKGEILIMSPTGGETGNRNAELIVQFGIWNRRQKLGKIFDSSTCFRLPLGSNRSPDLAFIYQERWDKLSKKDREKFPPIAPDFVLELLSPSDNLEETQAKMREYIDNGVKLGWLINRVQQQVEIYCLGKEKQVLINPEFLENQEILPKFNLDLSLIW